MPTPTLQQLREIESAAKEVAEYARNFYAGKTPRIPDGTGVKKELADAILATGGRSEWATQIIAEINERKGVYDRIVLNGAAGNKVQGYAQMLASAENAAKAERDSGQVSLVSIVGRGVPIDADGTNANHDTARKETARILESWIRNYPDKSALRERLGIKANEGFDIIDESGKLNRRNLDKAVRNFQEFNNLGVDGRIGSQTAQYLLSYKRDPGKFEVSYFASTVNEAVFGNGGAYLCGKTLSCDLQTYKDGTDKDKAADARKKAARDAIVEVRELIEGLKGTVISGDYLKDKDLTAAEKNALKTFSAAIKKDGNLTKEEIKAFQAAFGLGADGVIGRQTLATVGQISLRLSNSEVVDPSEIRAAVQTQTGGARRRTQQQG